MAREVISAHNYPDGTTLEDFGFALITQAFNSKHTVAEISPGRKYFGVAGSGTGNMYKNYATETLELLIMCDFTSSEIGRPDGFKVQADLGGGLAFAYAIDNTDTVVQDGFLLPSNVGAVTETAPDTAIPSITKAFCMKMRYDTVAGANTLKVRVWGAPVGGLQAAEPANWHYETTSNSTIARRVNMAGPTHPNGGYSSDMTAISIATDGDTAAFPALNQTVSTPPTPVLSNITDTGADSDWS